MVSEAGPEHKAAAMCLETKKAGNGGTLRSHCGLFQLFASVNLEIVFCKEANLES